MTLKRDMWIIRTLSSIRYNQCSTKFSSLVFRQMMHEGIFKKKKSFPRYLKLETKVCFPGVKAIDEAGIQWGIFTGGGGQPLLYLPLSPLPLPLSSPRRGSHEGNCISCNNYNAGEGGGGGEPGDEGDERRKHAFLWKFSQEEVRCMMYLWLWTQLTEYEQARNAKMTKINRCTHTWRTLGWLHGAPQSLSADRAVLQYLMCPSNGGE